MNKAIYRSMSIFIALTLTLGSFFSVSASSGSMGKSSLSSPLTVTKSYIVDKNNVGGKSCKDTWSGSIDQPFCTVEAALSRVQAGEGVFLRGGTYPNFAVTKSGTSSAYITISSYNGEKVLVSGGDDGIRLNAASYVRVYGFEVTGAVGNYGAGIRVTQKSGVSSSYDIIENNIVHDNLGVDTIGILIEDGSNNQVVNNKVYNNYFSGIWVISHSAESPNGISGNQVIGNESYNNTLGGGDSDGIGVSGEGTTNTLLMNNIVHGNSDDGIDTWNTSHNTLIGNIAYGQVGPGDGNGFKVGGSTTGGNNVVSQNIAYGNKRNGFDSNGSGGNAYYNNVAFYNASFGFEDGWRDASCTVGTCPSTFVNNIGYNNGRGNYSASEFTAVSHNNLWFSNSGGAEVSYRYRLFTSLSDFYASSGQRLDNPNGGDLASLQIDPQFKDTSNADFTLQASSPAINRGDPSNPAQVATTSRVDMGAREFVGNVQASIFADVPANYWAYGWVLQLYQSGITGGCSQTPLRYCPESSVTRAEMTVFLERGMKGASYTPPNVATQFGDTSSHWAKAWIDAAAADGITSGCDSGNFCPNDLVTRAQMAVFLLRAEHGATYAPPAATGTQFNDVPANYWAASWIEQLAAEGITGGCGNGSYCPDSTITRSQMAIFLVRTFNLQ